MKTFLIALVSLCSLNALADGASIILNASVKNNFAMRNDTIKILSDGQVVAASRGTSDTLLLTLSAEKLARVKTLIDSISATSPKIACPGADTAPHSSAVSYVVTNSAGTQVSLEEAPFSGPCQMLNDGPSSRLVDLANIFFSLKNL